jgi:hypothetical protein
MDMQQGSEAWTCMGNACNYTVLSLTAKSVSREYMEVALFHSEL